MKAITARTTGKVFGSHFKKDRKKMINPIKIQEEIKTLIQVLSTIGYDFTYDNEKNIITIRKKEGSNGKKSTKKV